MSRVTSVATMLMTLAHLSALVVSSFAFARCEATSSPVGVPFAKGSMSCKSKSAGFPFCALWARCPGDMSIMRAIPLMNPPPIGFPSG